MVIVFLLCFWLRILNPSNQYSEGTSVILAEKKRKRKNVAEYGGTLLVPGLSRQRGKVDL